MMAGHTLVVAEHQTLVIRRATPADAEVCGRICFDAFTTLANKHKFQPDFPAGDSCTCALDNVFAPVILLRGG